MLSLHTTAIAPARQTATPIARLMRETHRKQCLISYTNNRNPTTFQLRNIP